ncbi:Uncharacterised protein [Mycobacteroides abscessus subsp. abscessus]|nr:Uncharacterised protein [Mycobacteroides abscessus subsp. abscessus]
MGWVGVSRYRKLASNPESRCMSQMLSEPGSAACLNAGTPDVTKSTRSDIHLLATRWHTEHR